MRLELCAQLFLGEGSILDLGSLARRLANGARVKTELNLLASLVVGDVRGRDTFHAEDFDFVAITAWKRILNARKTAMHVRPMPYTRTR